MSDNGRKRRKHLTDHEAQQVEQIAAWKSEPPNPLSELWGMIAKPVAKALQFVIPNALARAAIERTDDAADLMAGQEDIKRKAGIGDLAELRDRPLEECDQMAHQVGLAAQALATAEGAATGAGGVWTTLLDVPLLFTLALRTIRKIGHCYGYKLDDQRGRSYVIGIMVTALSGSLDTRRERLQRLREIEDMMVEQTEEEVVTQEVLQFIFQLEAFEEVPGIGAASGALLNVVLMNRVYVAARKIFQERWLRDNGKVEEIEPAEAPAHILAGGLSGVLGRMAYSGCYYVGYGAAIPVFAVAAVFGPMNNAVTRGIRDGAAAAARGAERSLDGARAATASLVPSRRTARTAPA
jgi:EcsC protein family